MRERSTLSSHPLPPPLETPIHQHATRDPPTDGTRGKQRSYLTTYNFNVKICMNIEQGICTHLGTYSLYFPCFDLKLYTLSKQLKIDLGKKFLPDFSAYNFPLNRNYEKFSFKQKK